jgi:hypothetical protein
MVGNFTGNAGTVTEDAWDVIPESIDGESAPFGSVLLERHAGRRDRHPSPELSVLGDSCGVRLYGSFDCLFSTGWDRFTLITGKDAAALAGFLAELEGKGGFRGVETFAVTGRLDSFFRFGNRLQTSLTWLNEEDAVQ